ncbi:MAG: cell division protein FtsZ, partial [Bdellovibrionales bacterium]|nr:cell division protein FtsZ [Bdellovibrionales bacterium]
LLENIAIDGATGIIINVTGGSDLTLWEVNEASTLITEAAHEDAEIIFGAVIDEEMGDEVRVTVIATGFGEDNQTNIVSDQILRLQAMAEAQANQVTAVGQRLMDQMDPRDPVKTQSEVEGRSSRVNPSQVSPSSTPAVSSEVVSNTATYSPRPLSQPTEEKIEKLTPLKEESEILRDPLAEKAENELVEDLSDSEKPRLPRDILLAKAKAYRESQAKIPSSHPEQLSMNVEEESEALAAARRLAREVARSPFDAENLEVPSYLRKKHVTGEQNSEGSQGY